MAQPVQPIKVVGYCRVSDKKQEQDGHSLDAQKKLITDYCIKKGYKLTKIYSEQVSGSVNPLERTEFKKLIDDLTLGKASGLVVVKFDRLSRSLKDMVNIIDRYFKNNYKIHFIDFDHIDLTSPEGAFQLNLFSSFAELERSMIGKRTKNVLEYKKQKREKVGGKCPWGFKVIEVEENGKKIKRLIQNEEEQLLIKELKDLKENKQHTYKTLCNLLTLRGVKNRAGNNNWTPIQVLKMIYPDKCPRKSKFK
jgi:site-specific DNA recombinase